jgi:hypothetical protein
MKFATERPYADPERAARKLVEIANSVEALQEGRIFIELMRRCCSSTRRRRPNTRPASSWRSPRSCLWLHESGTYVRFMPAGAELFS